MTALCLLCAALCLGPAAWAQSTDASRPVAPARLQIPDVTLFGRDTVFLPVPPPEAGLRLAPEAAPAQGGKRLSLPHAPGPLLFPGPSPRPAVGRAAGPGAAPAGPGAASTGTASSHGAGDPGTVSSGEGGGSAGPGTAPSREWEASIDYVPTAALALGLAGQSVRGPWDTRSELALRLPDGWLDEGALQPGVVQASVQARREGVPLRLSLAASGGLLEPSSNPRTFSLEASQELRAAGRAVRFAESTAVQLQSRPESSPAQAAGACQRIELDVGQAVLGLRLEGAAAGRLETGSAEPETGALLTLAASCALRSGALRVEAGASALRYREGLSVLPAAALDLSPAAWLRLRGSAASFLRLVPDPETAALYTPDGEPLLGLEGGYLAEAALLVDLTPRFGASAAASYLDGHQHRLQDGSVRFGRDRRAGATAGLSWRLAPRVSLRGRAGAQWDLSEGPAGAALFAPAEAWASAWLQADFSKVPAAFIMQASWGQAPVGEADPAGFLRWELFDALQAAVRADLRVRPDQSLSAGLQVLVPRGGGAAEARFLAGYAARLSAFEPRNR